MKPRRALAVLCLGALVAGALALSRGSGRKQAPVEPREPTTQSTAVGVERPPRTTTRGSELLGINEGVAIADHTLTLGGAVQEKAVLTRRAMQVRRLGATAVRANSHVYPYLSMDAMVREDFDFSRADRFFQVLDQTGLDVVVVLGPWPGARTALYTDRYLPPDLDAYEEYVERVVERYDGDGTDDMPGLRRPVLAWEVDNEPDLHNSVSPRGGAGPPPETFQTPDEYATVLLATSRAIRRADPHALVLSGGLYRPMTPKGRAYLEAVLKVPGALEAIDALSLHCYFSEDHLEAVHRTMETARELAPDLPVWITETSVPSKGRKPWISDEWQARMTVGLIGAFLAEGADRIFWHSLSEPPRAREEGPLGFATNSLFRASTEGPLTTYDTKPAGEVFVRLTEHLAPVDLETAREVEAGEGRLLETDHGWLAFHGEPTVPDGAGTVIDLLTGETVEAGTTVEAPAWIARP